MDKELERVEITFSDGSHETYTSDVIIFALEKDGVACRASFRCKLEEATRLAMSMVIQAGEILKHNYTREGEGEVWTEEEDGFDFSKFF